MKLLRSYPSTLPNDRDYVEDVHTERFVHANYEYSGLETYRDDICLIEWDMAVDHDRLHDFILRATDEPEKVRVAPYKLYQPQGWVWAHRRYSADGAERWIYGGERYCELFGFGLIWLPRDLIRLFMEAPAPERGRPAHIEPGHYEDSRFIDQTFSMWYFRQGGDQVEVDWDVHAVHLHWER